MMMWYRHAITLHYMYCILILYEPHTYIFHLVLQVFWLKDGEMIDVKKEINFIISNEGNLIINQARLKDMGNYTCGAQNVASRRLSESATLTVYGKSNNDILCQINISTRTSIWISASFFKQYDTSSKISFLFAFILKQISDTHL